MTAPVESRAQVCDAPATTDVAPLVTGVAAGGWTGPEEGAPVHPTPAGDESGYDRSREWLVARYPLASEQLAAASSAVARVKRPVSVDGMPACLAPTGLRVVPTGPACFVPWPATDTYAAPCEGCSLRTRCPGIPTGYLARFGPGELIPPPPR